MSISEIHHPLGTRWAAEPPAARRVRPVGRLLLAVVMLLGMAAQACASEESPHPAAAPGQAADYLPLTPGRRWVLRHASGNPAAGEIVLQVLAVQDGVYHVRFDNPWTRAEWFLDPQNGRVFMLKGRLDGKTFDLPKGTLYFDFTAPAGRTWSNPIGTLCVKERNLSIRTPAGAWRSCLRVQETSPAGNTLLWTFAPGVGFVMFGEGRNAFVLDRVETTAMAPPAPRPGPIPSPAPAATVPPRRQGSRTSIAISANPLASEPMTPGAVRRRVKESLAAGVNAMYISMEYNKLAPRKGRFNTAELDGSSANARQYNLHDLLFTLRIVDTNNRSLPAELTRAAFNDPRLWDHLSATIDYLVPRLGGVSRINIGNEVDSYFSQHRGEIAAYAELFRKARNRLKQRLPGIRIGVTLSYGGLVNDDLRRALRPLLEASDYLSLTYYPLNADFTMRPPETVAGDFERMRELARELGKPEVVLQEVGYPSSPLNHSSPQQQAAFYRNVLQAVNRHPETFVFVNFFLMSDLPDRMVEEFAQYYKLPGQDRFKAYLQTLGLFDGKGAPKPAWGVLKAAVK